MTRVKKGINALKTRKNILSQVKGYRFGRSKKKGRPMKLLLMLALMPLLIAGTKKVILEDFGM